MQLFLKCCEFPCCINIQNEFLGVSSYMNSYLAMQVFKISIIIFMHYMSITCILNYYEFQHIL